MKTLRKIQEENKNLILDALKDSGIPLKTREIFTLEKILITFKKHFDFVEGSFSRKKNLYYFFIDIFDIIEELPWSTLSLDENGFNTLEAQSEEFQRKFNKILGG